MDVNEVVQTIITQAPNLIVAIWMLNNQKEQIKALLEQQNKLVDRLLNYVDKDKLLAANIQAGTVPKPDTRELRKLQ